MQITITVPSRFYTTGYVSYIIDNVGSMYDVTPLVTQGKEYSVNVTGDSSGEVKDDVGRWLTMVSLSDYTEELVFRDELQLETAYL
jgi:hypothetical protein